MTIPPLFAAKSAGNAAQAATKALTGDIYIRKWTSVTGKGTKKKLVDHEIRVNAVTGAVVAVGAGLTLGLGAMALWFAQRKVTPSRGRMIYRHLRVYEVTYKTVTVIDTPAYTETQYDHFGTPHQVTIPAVTHTEQQVARARQAVVLNSVGIPIRRFAAAEGVLLNEPSASMTLSATEEAKGWLAAQRGGLRYGSDALGKYTQYAVEIDAKTKLNLGTEERDGFSVRL